MDELLALMTRHIHWGWWVAVGILFLALEAIIPGFVLIWFGVGAFVVALINALWHTPLYMDLGIWSVLSVVMVIVAHRFVDKEERPERDFIGVRGRVVRRLDDGRYEVVLERPVLGSREWIAESEAPLDEGARVVVERVMGHYLIVKGVAS
jgi:membrane protein implicated in regulation of membrane protease activity